MMSLPTVDEQAPTYIWQWGEYSVYFAGSNRAPTRPVWPPRATPTVRPTVSHENAQNELEFHQIAATCPVCSCITTHCGGLYKETSVFEGGHRLWECKRRIYLHGQSACFADPA